MPDLVGYVKHLFSTHKHHTMATLRRDGSPGMSGTEVRFENGDLLLGMAPGTRRAADLRRDPRIAIHSHSVDPPEGDHGSWAGEAKIQGRAVEVPPESGEQQNGEAFRVLVEEVVLTRIGDPADHLLIESWVLGRGLKSFRR